MAYYLGRMQSSHLYSVFFAPRGAARMLDLGMQISQQFLSPNDRLIGIMGIAGSGKSMLVKGMFPGLELSNDDQGVNVRPLPILNIDDRAFYSAHTYHLDIRFESAFTQMCDLADAISNALDKGKRVIVEHFELIYPFLKRNANLLIGVGEEIIITRPNLFGPEPQDLAEIVEKSIPYRRMAHSAEDLCEHFILQQCVCEYEHDDVRHGFILSFAHEKPPIDMERLEHDMMQAIADDIPISYLDERHIMIGDVAHSCTGPRNHVRSTKEIESFSLKKDFYYDIARDRYLIVGLVSGEWQKKGSDLNKIVF